MLGQVNMCPTHNATSLLEQPGVCLCPACPRGCVCTQGWKLKPCPGQPWSWASSNPWSQIASQGWEVEGRGEVEERGTECKEA